MLIGYARVSTQSQKLALQLDALKKAGCDKIHSDKASGINTDRPGLTRALAELKKGDTLVIWKLDRLGRNLRDLIRLAEELEAKEIHFRSITDGIDTSTAIGRFFFHVMAALSQMERDIISERTRAGLAAARAQGKTGGRPPKMTPTKIEAARKLLLGGMPPAQVASTLAVSVSTLYRWLPASKLREEQEELREEEEEADDKAEEEEADGEKKRSEEEAAELLASLASLVGDDEGADGFDRLLASFADSDDAREAEAEIPGLRKLVYLTREKLGRRYE